MKYDSDFDPVYELFFGFYCIVTIIALPAIALAMAISAWWFAAFLIAMLVAMWYLLLFQYKRDDWL